VVINILWCTGQINAKFGYRAHTVIWYSTFPFLSALLSSNLTIKLLIIHF